MKSLLKAALGLLLLCSATGCKQDFSCENLKKGEWAVQFFDDLGQSGDCPYEGTAMFEGEELVVLCEVSGKQCICSVGHEFGTYNVTFTNRETGETDHSIVEVEAAPEPICIDLNVVGTFEPTPGEGGAGGQGGANN